MSLAVILFSWIDIDCAKAQLSTAAAPDEHAPVIPADLYKTLTPEKAATLLSEGDRFLARDHAGADQQRAIGDRVFGYILLGFIAEISKGHPDWVPVLVANAKSLTPRGRLLLIISLAGSHSEQSAEALTTLRLSGMADLVDRVAKTDTTNTLTFPVISPDVLYTYAGAYSASGNQSYIIGMIDGLDTAMPWGGRPNYVMTQLIPLELGLLAKRDPAVRQTLDKENSDAKYSRISGVLKSVLEQSER